MNVTSRLIDRLYQFNLGMHTIRFKIFRVRASAASCIVLWLKYAYHVLAQSRQLDYWFSFFYEIHAETIILLKSVYCDW